LSRTAIALLAALLLAAGQERNLLENGGFDEGPSGASEIPGWTEVDGLTTFFPTEPGRGRVLRIDTDVRLAEANARWEEMARPREERPPPKPKGPTVEPKYDTVGGTTGAKIYSDYLRVEPGMRYRLTVDVKSTNPTVKIFVKGYARFQGGWRKFYQCYRNVTDRPADWTTYERTFNPTIRSPKVTHIRVMPYAYWPPGEAWVDDVRITRVGKEEEGPAAEGENVLANGTFEKGLSPWTKAGPASRVARDDGGWAVRLESGGRIVGGLVAVDADRPYALSVRARPDGALLVLRVEGLLKFGGRWTALFDDEETAPPDADGWTEIVHRFHPTRETPQVTHVRITLLAKGASGSVLVDDVSLAPAKAGER